MTVAAGVTPCTGVRFKSFWTGLELDTKLRSGVRGVTFQRGFRRQLQLKNLLTKRAWR